MLSLNQSEKRDRQRAKNFTPYEEDVLLQLLQPYKTLIDNKRSDALTCLMKKEAWEKLSHDFTLKTGIHRTWRTLKDKYKNINTKLKMQSKQIRPINQFDDFEPQPSSCVAVVYEGEKDSSLDYLQDNTNDDIELPMTTKTESINEEVSEIFPMASTSQPPPLPIPEEARTNNFMQFFESQTKILSGLQQNFYFNQNERAEQKHRLEMENLNLQKQLIEKQHEEIRQRMKRGKENPTIPPTDDKELAMTTTSDIIDKAPIQQEVSEASSSQPRPLPSPDTKSENKTPHVHLMQVFYFNANGRADEEHRLKLENNNLKNKLLEEESRQRLKRRKEST